VATTNELLDRFVGLFNENRIEEWVQDYAADAYFEEIGTGRRMTPTENGQNARAWQQAFPDARGMITSKVVEGNKGAAEIVWRGTHQGMFFGQPGTGQSVTVRAFIVIESDGSKIRRATHYLDVAGMMAQLGGAAAKKPTGVSV